MSAAYLLAIDQGTTSTRAIVYDGQIVETANTAELIEYPMHPYTLMLMAAFSQNPRLRSMWTKAGSRIASEAGRQACPFAPRCVSPFGG